MPAVTAEEPSAFTPLIYYIPACPYTSKSKWSVVEGQRWAKALELSQTYGTLIKADQVGQCGST